MKPLTSQQVADLKHGNRLKCIDMGRGYRDKLEVGQYYLFDKHKTAGFIEVQNATNCYHCKHFALIRTQATRRTCK